MPFELGRTLLAKGMIERRDKNKLAARRSLGRALGIFEHLGASLWVAKARRELSRVDVRSAAAGLTDTENQVAALVVKGLTNREVASSMFVTENTVQTHVRHIFQKLGVRSRTELAAQLLSAQANPRTASRRSVGPDRPEIDVRITGYGFRGSDGELTSDSHSVPEVRFSSRTLSPGPTGETGSGVAELGPPPPGVELDLARGDGRFNGFS
jgi:DNA-binding CsgD family transcriptional regulator